MVNPATQTNKIITFLIVDAYKTCNQDLDETEDIKVHLIDFNEMGIALKTNKIKTQVFTTYAYLMAKDFLAKN